MWQEMIIKQLNVFCVKNSQNDKIMEYIYHSIHNMFNKNNKVFYNLNNLITLHTRQSNTLIIWQNILNLLMVSHFCNLYKYIHIKIGIRIEIET